MSDQPQPGSGHAEPSLEQEDAVGHSDHRRASAGHGPAQIQLLDGPVVQGGHRKADPPVAAEVDPIEHARKMIDHIDKKRKALGIDRARERVLMTMADRQRLEA